ncbi:MAG: hypothetical protein ACPL68_06080 [Candidatus Hydrothermia bacterium]
MLSLLLLCQVIPEPDSLQVFQPANRTEEQATIKWRWAKGDHWKTTAKMSDKIEHFVGGYLGTLPLLVIGDASGWPWLSDPVVVSSVASVAFLWEVKDAYYNPENFPSEREQARPYHFVGDGFSWRDMVASWAGVAAAYGTIMLARHLAERREQ